MESNWAEENLQVIRTLMERSALYRRALAPMMLTAGVVGLVAGVAAWVLKIDSPTGAVGYWLVVAALCLLGAARIVRHQARKAGEPFWTLPTRKVGQAIALPFILGGWLGMPFVGLGFHVLISLWSAIYGIALFAAGFFVSKGVRKLGLAFFVAGCLLLIFPRVVGDALSGVDSHLLMGALFGGLHLVSGCYLYFTEEKDEAA